MAKEGASEILHGVSILDPYRWLENPNNPDTIAFVNEQDKRAREILNKLPLKEQLKMRFKELYDINSFGLLFPVKLKNPETGNFRFFQSRHTPGRKFSILYYRDGLDGEQKVAIDPNTFSADGTLSMTDYSISKDGRKITYNISKSGSDRVDIHVKDLETGEILPDVIKSIRYPGISWRDDVTGFYYTRWPDPNNEEDKKYDHRVYFHKLGTDNKDDIPIFGKDLSTKLWVSAYLPPDTKYLLFTISEGWRKTDVYYKDLESNSGIKPLIIGKDAKFSTTIIGEIVYTQTDYKAPKGRILTFPISNPDEKSWQELVPEKEDVLENFGISGNYTKLTLNYMSNIHSKVFVCDMDGKNRKEIGLPLLGTVSGLTGARKGNEIFYMFTSFTTPGILYRYDLVTGDSKEIERTKIDFNMDDFEVKQVWYESKDNIKVPMFIISKKGIKQDGNNPVLLYGYGGFSISLAPGFNSFYAVMAERGCVVAVPNLRGGNEFGEDWHKAGMLERKQNTFNDFIAAAEWLISNDYTNRNRLLIYGGSNGGLLVGACMIQRPDMFKAVVCSAPVLDMLRFHKMAGGPLWITEYGNPDVEAEFKYLVKYSPYHNLKEGQTYPPILFMSAENDTRVDPMHALKMAAKMMDYNPKNTVIVRTERNLGHGFGTTIESAVERSADAATFICWQLGIEK